MNFMHHLPKRRTGATMIELIAVMAIMGLGIGALLQTLVGGIYYAKDTEDNIKAINIAREGIEGVINIRDTNWLRFSSDKVNCWKTKDYNGNCIGNSLNSGSPSGDPGNTNIGSGSYVLYSQNGIWILSGMTSIDPVTNWTAYKPSYKVGLDTTGFYTQTGVSTTTCSSSLQNSCLTIFTREVIINNPTQSGSLNITSIVRWIDRRPQSVVLNSTITNWKSNF